MSMMSIRNPRILLHCELPKSVRDGGLACGRCHAQKKEQFGRLLYHWGGCESLLRILLDVKAMGAKKEEWVSGWEGKVGSVVLVP